MKRSRCDYCGTTGLEWIDTEDGWRLYGWDGRHSCPEYREAKADDVVIRAMSNIDQELEQLLRQEA